MASDPFALAFEDLPKELIVFPLPGALLLPHGRLPLNIFEPRYLALVEEALAFRRLIGMIQPTGELEPDSTRAKLFQVGCAGRIHSFNEIEDGRYLISLVGVARFRIVEEVEMRRGFRRVRADWQAYLADLSGGKACLVNRSGLLEQLRCYFNLQGIASEWEMIEKTDDEKLITSLAMICPFTPCEKQALLEAPDMEERCRLLTTLMNMASLEDEECEAVRH